MIYYPNDYGAKETQNKMYKEEQLSILMLGVKDKLQLTLLH